MNKKMFKCGSDKFKNTKRINKTRKRRRSKKTKKSSRQAIKPVFKRFIKAKKM